MEFGHKLLVASVHAKGVVSSWNVSHPDLSIEAGQKLDGHVQRLLSMSQTLRGRSGTS